MWLESLSISINTGVRPRRRRDSNEKSIMSDNVFVRPCACACRCGALRREDQRWKSGTGERPDKDREDASPVRKGEEPAIISADQKNQRKQWHRFWQLDSHAASVKGVGVRSIMAVLLQWGLRMAAKWREAIGGAIVTSQLLACQPARQRGVPNGNIDRDASAYACHEVKCDGDPAHRAMGAHSAIKNPARRVRLSMTQS